MAVLAKVAVDDNLSNDEWGNDRVGHEFLAFFGTDSSSYTAESQLLVHPKGVRVMDSRSSIGVYDISAPHGSDDGGMLTFMMANTVESALFSNTNIKGGNQIFDKIFGDKLKNKVSFPHAHIQQ